MVLISVNEPVFIFEFLNFISSCFFSVRRNNFFGDLKISGITFNYCRKNVERLLDARLPGTLLFRITKAIHAQQEDFQSHRITVMLLYRLKLSCQEVKRNKQKGAVISIEFEKAFDSVWINGLLKKLHQSGVKDKLLKLIADILKNRHLSIQIGNENTDCFRTKIELPQRSVISTILFFFLSVTCSMGSEVQIRRLWKPARDSRYWTSTCSQLPIHPESTGSLL